LAPLRLLYILLGNCSLQQEEVVGSHEPALTSSQAEEFRRNAPAGD